MECESLQSNMKINNSVVTHMLQSHAVIKFKFIIIIQATLQQID